MTPEQVLVANVVAVLLLATLAGLTARGRVRPCRSFAAYLALALTTNRLVTWWPERFYTRDFWTFKETLQAILILLVALELTVVGFEAFPRARRAGVVALMLIAGVTALAVAAEPAPDYAARMGVLARAQAGVAWSLVAFLAIASWYRLPLHPMHRSITLGFALNLGVYGTLLSAVGHFGWSAYRYLAALDPAAYAATVVLWMLAAWRPARRDEEATERLWAQLLSPAIRRAWEALGLRLEAQERALEFTRRQAREAAKAGEAEEAARLVEAGRVYETQTRLERHRLALLRRMQSALRRRSG